MAKATSVASYEYSILSSKGGKLSSKFDIYKYQKTGLMRLNVEHMAQQKGVQLPDPAQTAALVKQQVNLDKLEAQLSKQTKRFKVLNNEYNKRNSSGSANHVQSSSSLSKKAGSSAKGIAITSKEEAVLTPKDNL